MTRNILADLVAPSPVLTEITQYYARLPCNQLRAKTTFLFCRATNGAAQDWNTKIEEAKTSASEADLTDLSETPHEYALPSQILVAESVELIHMVLVSCCSFVLKRN